MDDSPLFTSQAKAGVSCRNAYFPEVAHQHQYAGVEGDPVIVVVIGLGCDWGWPRLPSSLGGAGTRVIIMSSDHIKGKNN